MNLYKQSVYIIQLGNLPYYKIGMSYNIQQRLDSIQINLPLQIKTLYIAEVNDNLFVERSIKKQYCKKRTRGEWFKLTKTDITKIIKFLKSVDINLLDFE